MVEDLRRQKIPNVVTYSMMLFGIIFHIVNAGLAGLIFSIEGMFVGTGIFIIPYLLGGMGAGDAKLMGGVGAILGVTGVIIAAVISILLGLIYAIILLLINWSFGRSFLKRSYTTLKTFLFTKQWVPIPPPKGEKQPVLCYALPIAVGTLYTVYIKFTGSGLIQDLLGFQFVI
nr:A24 family peptidase [Desulfosarcina widdelii]